MLPDYVIIAMTDPMTTVCVFPGVVGKRQMSAPDQTQSFTRTGANVLVGAKPPFGESISLRGNKRMALWKIAGRQRSVLR